MNFGNASWGFRETPLETQLKITKDMGLKYLELDIANAANGLPLDASNEQLEDVKRLYDKYSILLTCAATGNDFTVGDRDLDKVKKAIDICQKLSVKYLRIFAGFTPVDEVVGEKWDVMIDCLNQVADYAKDKGVTLTVETHGGVNGYDDGVEHVYSTSSKPEVLYKMLDQLDDSIMVNFDPANLWAVGEKAPEEIYNKIKDRVAVMHLKDFAPLESGHILPACCGDSQMDWTKILDAVKDFEGPMLFEYENVEDIEQGSIKCRDYIYNLVR